MPSSTPPGDSETQGPKASASTTLPRRFCVRSAAMAHLVRPASQPQSDNIGGDENGISDNSSTVDRPADTDQQEGDRIDHFQANLPAADAEESPDERRDSAHNSAHSAENEIRLEPVITILSNVPPAWQKDDWANDLFAGYGAVQIDTRYVIQFKNRECALQAMKHWDQNPWVKDSEEKFSLILIDETDDTREDPSECLNTSSQSVHDGSETTCSERHQQPQEDSNNAAGAPNGICSTEDAAKNEREGASVTPPAQSPLSAEEVEDNFEESSSDDCGVVVNESIESTSQGPVHLKLVNLDDTIWEREGSSWVNKVFKEFGLVRWEFLTDPHFDDTIMDSLLITVRDNECAQKAIQRFPEHVKVAVQLQDQFGGEDEEREIEHPVDWEPRSSVFSEWIQKQDSKFYSSIRSHRKYQKGEKERYYQTPIYDCGNDEIWWGVAPWGKGPRLTVEEENAMEQEPSVEILSKVAPQLVFQPGNPLRNPAQSLPDGHSEEQPHQDSEEPDSQFQGPQGPQYNADRLSDEQAGQASDLPDFLFQGPQGLPKWLPEGKFQEIMNQEGPTQIASVEVDAHGRPIDFIGRDNAATHGDIKPERLAIYKDIRQDFMAQPTSNDWAVARKCQQSYDNDLRVQQQQQRTQISHPGNTSIDNMLEHREAGVRFQAEAPAPGGPLIGPGETHYESLQDALDGLHQGAYGTIHQIVPPTIGLLAEGGPVQIWQRRADACLASELQFRPIERHAAQVRPSVYYEESQQKSYHPYRMTSNRIPWATAVPDEKIVNGLVVSGDVKPYPGPGSNEGHEVHVAPNLDDENRPKRPPGLEHFQAQFSNDYFDPIVPQEANYHCHGNAIASSGTATGYQTGFYPVSQPAPPPGFLQASLPPAPPGFDERQCHFGAPYTQNNGPVSRASLVRGEDKLGPPPQKPLEALPGLMDVRLQQSSTSKDGIATDKSYPPSQEDDIFRWLRHPRSQQPVAPLEGLMSDRLQKPAIPEPALRQSIPSFKPIQSDVKSSHDRDHQVFEDVDLEGRGDRDHRAYEGVVQEEGAIQFNLGDEDDSEKSDRQHAGEGSIVEGARHQDEDGVQFIKNRPIVPIRPDRPMKSPIRQKIVLREPEDDVDATLEGEPITSLAKCLVEKIESVGPRTEVEVTPENDSVASHMIEKMAPRIVLDVPPVEVEAENLPTQSAVQQKLQVMHPRTAWEEIPSAAPVVRESLGIMRPRTELDIPPVDAASIIPEGNYAAPLLRGQYPADQVKETTDATVFLKLFFILGIVLMLLFEVTKFVQWGKGLFEDCQLIIEHSTMAQWAIYHSGKVGWLAPRLDKALLPLAFVCLAFRLGLLLTAGGGGFRGFILRFQDFVQKICDIWTAECERTTRALEAQHLRD